MSLREITPEDVERLASRFETFESKGGDAAVPGQAGNDVAPGASASATGGANAWARAAFDAEVGKVRGAAKGSRNDALNEAAFALGQIVAGGSLSRQGVEMALRNAALAVGLSLKEINATLRSGLDAGAKEPRRRPETAFPEIPATVVAAAAEMAARKAPRPASDPFAAIDPGVDWRTPRGLIGQISDWILETSRRPNRPLAVAAATAILSTICGRHLYAPTGTALNLYIVTLAKTGAGKDRPLSAINEVLTAAKLPQLAQTAKAFSVSGFERLIAENPCCCATIDEMGANLLARLANKRASHEAGEGIKAALQELWSRVYAKGPFMTTRRASSASEAIASPSLTLYGASTPEAFYDCFRAGDALSGFLNRFLIAEGARLSPVNEFDYHPVPVDIVDTIQAMIPQLDGNIGDAMGVFRAPSVKETKMRWADAATKAEALRLENAIAEIAQDHRRGELLARTFEYSVRVASLHAVSMATLYVGRDDLAWGASWALTSARAMISAADELMAENEHEGFVNRVKAIVKRAGTIGRSELRGACPFLRGRDFDGIIEQLAEAGVIEKLEIRGKAGPPGRAYRWVG